MFGQQLEVYSASSMRGQLQEVTHVTAEGVSCIVLSAHGGTVTSIQNTTIDGLALFYTKGDIHSIPQHQR